MAFLDRETARMGSIYALSAYLFWGVAPLYFVAMSGTSSVEILIHRSLWSCVFLGIWVTISARWHRVRQVFVSPKMFLTVLITAPLIMANWGVFVWAIEFERLTDASLGYFLNPLMFIVGGMIVFQERLTRCQWLAVIIASAGVLYLIVKTGELIWIPLVLASTFAAFGLARKWASIPPTGGLFVETALMLPFSVLLFFFWPMMGSTQTIWQFGADLYSSVMLAGVGIVTVLPLIWFNAGAQRLPYKYMGILQFLAPSIMFVLAIFVLKEPLVPEKLHAFLAIWAALALFAYEQFMQRPRVR